MGVCTTTSTPHSHLIHHVSSGSMSVALRLNSSSDLVVTSNVMKRRDEHTQTQSWFVNTEVYKLQQFLVVVERRETAYEKWIDLFR